MWMWGCVRSPRRCAANASHARMCTGARPGAACTRVGSWAAQWASSKTRGLVITALDTAATTRGTVPAGGVLHTDWGTQFTSEKLAAYMRAVQEAVSTGWAGVCWDNTVVESFWATLTIEYHYRRTFTTRE